MNRQKRFIVWLGLLLMLMVISASSVACWGSPLFDLMIENQTGQTLTVFIDGLRIGEVGPGGQITRKNTPWDIGEYLIEAKNAQGEVIFDETLTRSDMQRIDNKRIYKATIPPLTKAPESSNNVTGK
jgi:hypothetical protein